MPTCTARYAVRLLHPDVSPSSAIGIYAEERREAESGEPGELVSRRLKTFDGPNGRALLAMVRTGGWRVEIETPRGPAEWAS